MFLYISLRDLTDSHLSSATRMAANLTLQQRRADDHGYLLAIGAKAFDQPKFRAIDRQFSSTPASIARHEDFYVCFKPARVSTGVVRMDTTIR